MERKLILDIYASLMRDIKVRLATMRDIIRDPRAIPNWAVIEFSQLQIRMISETLAVACLIAHGEDESFHVGKVMDAYQADYIMKRLEQLNPYFYPRPSRQIIFGDGRMSWEYLKDGYLTKKEFLASYHAAAAFLHVGSARYFLARQPKPFDPRSISDWISKVVRLLDHHHISLVDPPDTGEPPLDEEGIPIPKFQIVSMMQSKDDGEPKTSWFQFLDDRN